MRIDVLAGKMNRETRARGRPRHSPANPCMSYLNAIDGFHVQAALWQPQDKPPAETTIIVGVHGSGGNLGSLPLRVIARALSAEGYAALSVSTRQHDEHVNTDNFFDVRRDIEAAVVTAKTFGYTPIPS